MCHLARSRRRSERGARNGEDPGPRASGVFWSLGRRNSARTALTTWFTSPPKAFPWRISAQHTQVDWAVKVASLLGGTYQYVFDSVPLVWGVRVVRAPRGVPRTAPNGAMRNSGDTGSVRITSHPPSVGASQPGRDLLPSTSGQVMSPFAAWRSNDGPGHSGCT